MKFIIHVYTPIGRVSSRIESGHTEEEIDNLINSIKKDHKATYLSFKDVANNDVIFKEHILENSYFVIEKIKEPDDE